MKLNILSWIFLAIYKSSLWSIYWNLLPFKRNGLFAFLLLLFFYIICVFTFSQEIFGYPKTSNICCVFL